MDVLVAMANAIHETITAVGQPCLDASQVRSLDPQRSAPRCNVVRCVATCSRCVATSAAVLQHAAARLQVAQAVEVIKMLLTESAERKRERILKKGSEDCDEEEGELMDDQNLQEEELLDEAASIVTALLKTDAQVFMQHCTPILNITARCSRRPTPPTVGRRCAFSTTFSRTPSLSPSASSPAVPPDLSAAGGRRGRRRAPSGRLRSRSISAAR